MTDRGATLTGPDSLSGPAQHALALLAQAGELTRDWFARRGRVRVEDKADGTPVTQADREIELLLREGLAEVFPDDGIYGEEFGETHGGSGCRWIIDPIDGTKSFVHGVPLFANLIARECDGEITFGAIGLPALGCTVYAERGAGCWRDRERLHVSAHHELADAYLMATWLEDWPGAVLDEARRRRVVVRTWGDAFGYAMVAAGEADAIVDHRAEIYDLAPMPVIIAEAGGRFTCKAGSDSHARGSGVASNGLIHDAVMALIN
ncbi:inositol monophosphatase family protein [Naumannella huperziae]